MGGTGSFSVADGARLVVSGGSNALTGDGSVTGTGTLEMKGGSLWVYGDYDVTSTAFTGFGRLHIIGTGRTDSLSLDNGELNGSGEITVDKYVMWNGGSMGGTGKTILGANIPFSIEGANVGLKEARTLQVDGPTTWSGDADFSNGTDAVFENAGTLTLTGPGERSFFAGVFYNSGDLLNLDGDLIFNSGMSNDGTITIEAGSVTQRGFSLTGGTDTGRYELATSGTLDFAGGNRTLTASSAVVGTGTLVFSGGNLTNDATWMPGPVSGGIGTMNVNSNFPVGGTVEFEIGGTVPGSEHDQFQVSGTTTLGGIVDISFVNGFEANNGDRFLLISATGGATGQLDSLKIPSGVDAFIEKSALGVELVIGIPVDNEVESAVPTEFSLSGVYPNPFSEDATILFDVPATVPVDITLFDALGRAVATVVDDSRNTGTHSVRIDGRQLSAGVYFVRMVAGEFAGYQRVVVVR